MQAKERELKRLTFRSMNERSASLKNRPSVFTLGVHDGHKGGMRLPGGKGGVAVEINNFPTSS